MKIYSAQIKRFFIQSFLCLVFGIALLAICIFSITSLDDPLSTKIRSSTESHVNQYIDRLATKAELGELHFIDKTVIHASIKMGVLLTRWVYPEASILLDHYVYGSGADLELSSTYFKDSTYLKSIISQYGLGDHGPIGLKQSDDWRLSLALNPYYLSIGSEVVKLYHPNISFAPTQSDRVFTIVPIGKLNIKVYDNLVSAVNSNPFYAYSTWKVDGK